MKDFKVIIVSGWMLPILCSILGLVKVVDGGNIKYQTSPNYPNNYPNDQHLTQTLSVQTGGSILVTFQDFVIEGHPSHGCRYDYVQFCDGNGKCGDKLCGTSLPKKFTIDTSTATVLFHSDHSVSPKGYKLSYQTGSIDGEWSDWGECSKRCDGGIRKRTCSNPAPERGGAYCERDSLEECNKDVLCVIGGGWSAWSDFGSCNAICGSATKTRMRSCSNPPSSPTGQTCQGSNEETVKCSLGASECNGNGTLLSTAPGSDMVLCKDENRNTCEKDLEILCPVGWHLCSQKEFNNRNDDWNYNWKNSSDNGPGNTNTDRDGIPFGVIYCWKHGGATNFGINGDMLNVDVPANCWNHNGIWASRPGCEKWAEGGDCNNKYASALCCSQTSTCGNGVVDGIEEECDDGNNNEMDDCLRSCTWKTPADHGLSPCRGDLG